MLPVKVIDGIVYKLIEVTDDCICNRDYFKSAMKQLIEDYVTILDKDEIIDFTSDVIEQVMPSEIKLGDYVHASKYSDRDPNDPWRIGFVVRIIDERYIIGEFDGSFTDHREYRHAKKITPDEGEAWLNFHGDH